MPFSCKIVAFWLITASYCSLGANANYQLQIDKVSSDYLEIELNLWRNIDRRAENTLEQIYYNHKSSLSENLFQNFAVRNRITLNGTLEDALASVNEKALRAFGYLKNRDYGGLNEFVRGSAADIISALTDIDRYCSEPHFWEDLKSVGFCY